MKMKNKKTVVILSVLILAGIAFYRLFIADEFICSEYSPDKRYRVDIYAERRYFSMPGGGGADSRMAVVVLKDKWGRTIGKSCKSEECCRTILSSIEIEWDYLSGRVWFAKARMIDLETGECSY